MKTKETAYGPGMTREEATWNQLNNGMDKDYINIGEPDDKLIEECSEVIKALIKARRFGLMKMIPNTGGVRNVDRIRDEIKDLKLALKNYETFLINEEHGLQS